MNNISSMNTANIAGYSKTPGITKNETSQQNQVADQVSIGGRSDSPEFVPGELIVRFKGAAPQNMTLRNGISAEIIKTFDMPLPSKEAGSLSETQGELCHIKLNGATVEQAIDALSHNKNVEYAEPNYILRVPENEDDPGEAQGGNPASPAAGKRPNDLHKELWGLENKGQTGGKPGVDIDAANAWTISTGKREGGPLIAVVDTGIDYNHPDLKNNIWTNPGEIAGDGKDNDGNGYIDDVHGYDFYGKKGDPMDNHSHGTHCAGTIGAEGNNGQGITGVAWNAKIMGLKFMDTGGGTTAGAIDAINYATKMGVDIASNSWGGGGFSQALKDAISGFPGLFIAAAGNSTVDNDAKPHYPSSYNLPNMIAVASTDANDKLSTFSNYGKKSVDIAAPGSRIFSTIPGGGFALKSGTSMATPHVSGVAALIMSKYPELSIADVKEAILQGGDDVAELKDKVATGKRLNAYKSLQVASEKAAKMNE